MNPSFRAMAMSTRFDYHRQAASGSEGAFDSFSNSSPLALAPSLVIFDGRRDAHTTSDDLSPVFQRRVSSVEDVFSDVDGKWLLRNVIDRPKTVRNKDRNWTPCWSCKEKKVKVDNIYFVFLLFLSISPLFARAQVGFPFSQCLRVAGDVCNRCKVMHLSGCSPYKSTAPILPRPLAHASEHVGRREEVNDVFNEREGRLHGAGPRSHNATRNTAASLLNGVETSLTTAERSFGSITRSGTNVGAEGADLPPPSAAERVRLDGDGQAYVHHHGHTRLRSDQKSWSGRQQGEFGIRPARDSAGGDAEPLKHRGFSPQSHSRHNESERSAMPGVALGLEQQRRGVTHPNETLSRDPPVTIASSHPSLEGSRPHPHRGRHSADSLSSESHNSLDSPACNKIKSNVNGVRRERSVVRQRCGPWRPWTPPLEDSITAESPRSTPQSSRHRVSAQSVNKSVKSRNLETQTVPPNTNNDESPTDKALHGRTYPFRPWTPNP